MASNLTRWNPVRDLMTMQNVMDRFFDENWRPLFEETRAGSNPLALDVHEDDHSYTISTDLPGLKPEDINIRQEGEFVVIEAETRDEFEQQPQEGRRALIKERRYGHYSRRLRLPQNVNFEQAEATYNDGVLTLHVPKAPEAQPRTIQVKSGHNGNTGNGNKK